MLQRIKYTDKEGLPMDLVVQIVKKLSKDVIVRIPEDGREIHIPRHAISEITEAKIEIEK